MATIEVFSLNLSLASIALVLILTIIAFIRQQSVIAATRTAKSKSQPSRPATGSAISRTVTGFIVCTLVLNSLVIISRAIETGHGPFSSMYEFAVAFAWGVIVMGVLFRWHYKTVAMLNIGLIVAFMLLIFARVQYARPGSLVPALQQSALLSTHVAAAVVAYGTLTIGFGAAILLLIQEARQSAWLPDAEVLDTVGYRSVTIGFPFLTILIVLGAFWADIAWGRYWSWDPKETASLVTWFIYAAYMHARVMRGWRRKNAAILLIIGFAAILLTFFGNYIFTGLHAYG
jgi:cytochrome c-type biogenesis protein CcsB